jgi:uncharacterized protein YjbJ (UPF0337 family)
MGMSAAMKSTPASNYYSANRVRHRTDRWKTVAHTFSIDRAKGTSGLSLRSGASVRTVPHNTVESVERRRATVFRPWRSFRPFTGIRYEEQVMSTNKDQIKGRVREAEGKIKEVAGKLVGNEKLKERGTAQKVLGEVQAKFGDVKQDVQDSRKRR